MHELLAGIDDSIFDAIPSPDQPQRHVPSKTKVQPSPVRCIFKTPEKQQHGRVATPKSTRSPAQTKENGQAEDLVALLEGAEDWDWEDMHADFLTPKKTVPCEQKVRQSKRGYLTCHGKLLSLRATRTMHGHYNSKPPRRFLKGFPNHVHDAWSNKFCMAATCARQGNMCCFASTKLIILSQELLVSTEPDEESRKVILRDDWAMSSVKSGRPLSTQLRERSLKAQCR